SCCQIVFPYESCSFRFLVEFPCNIHPGLKGHPTSCLDHTCLAVFASPSSPYRHCRIIFARARLLFIAVIVERRVFGILFCFVLFCCCFVIVV
ncbi:Uncharacterized protein APZ42_008965, partial [Daphnia magna]